jgi:hypothetical protein
LEGDGVDENVNDEAAVDGTATGRRDLLKKAAVGGAVVWAAPMVLAGTASAQASPPLPPNPPSCTFVPLAPNWNSIEFPPQSNPVQRFTGPIGTTGFVGNNADVVNGAYFITPAWTAPNNWVDLVGLGAAGSITAQFTVPCTGTYELRFRYSRYIGNATVSTSVNGHNNGPFNAPPQTSPATFTQQYTLNAGEVVNLTMSGTAATPSQGPAVNDITFSLLTP